MFSKERKRNYYLTDLECLQLAWASSNIYFNALGLRYNLLYFFIRVLFVLL